MSDDYKNFLLTATPQQIIDQLNLEVKEPLVSAQNVVNMLQMSLNPSPALAKKLETGEFNWPTMLEELTVSITRVLDVLDFYRETLNGE